MRKRNMKGIFLLLAASMVFTMNTAVFAEEIPADAAGEIAAEETGDVVESETATEEEAVGAEEAAGEETVGAEEATGGASAELDADDKPADFEEDGIWYTWEKDGDSYKVKPKTTITYAKDSTNKKATVNDVATITDTTDPLSWNNFYGTALIETVLSGTNKEDEWLNNSSKAKVSENKAEGLKELRGSYDDDYYKVIPITSGSTYLFVAYGL